MSRVRLFFCFKSILQCLSRHADHLYCDPGCQRFSQIVLCAVKVMFARSPTAVANVHLKLPLGLLYSVYLLGLPESYCCSSCTT